MKKLLIFLLLLLFAVSTVIVSSAENEENYTAEYTSLPSADFTVEATSALLMEANTGEILFSQNENNRASPASVTKIMTLLLIMEAIEDERISKEDIVRKQAFPSAGTGRYCRYIHSASHTSLPRTGGGRVRRCLPVPW